jgi:hypothetical protein
MLHRLQSNQGRNKFEKGGVDLQDASGQGYDNIDVSDMYSGVKAVIVQKDKYAILYHVQLIASIP